MRHEVADYARSVGVADAFAVSLALSETVSNAIVHAYIDEATPGDVEVHAEPTDAGAALRVTVVDHGRGMIPRGDSPGIGAGLPLISRVTTRFDISKAPDGGTQVCMVFPLAEVS